MGPTSASEKWMTRKLMARGPLVEGMKTEVLAMIWPSRGGKQLAMALVTKHLQLTWLIPTLKTEMPLLEQRSSTVPAQQTLIPDVEDERRVN